MALMAFRNGAPVRSSAPLPDEYYNGSGVAMRDVLKSTDPVLLNFAETLLRNAGIDSVVFDGHMSIMDGSLGILPRRLMVIDSDYEHAMSVLAAAVPDMVTME
jgi:hypothetical protein